MLSIDSGGSLVLSKVITSTEFNVSGEAYHVSGEAYHVSGKTIVSKNSAY